MPNPKLRVIDNEHEHPRDRARRLVNEWRSDADRENLPVSNRHDDKGAPVLDVDHVIRRTQPEHAARLTTQRRSLWSRLRRRGCRFVS